MKTILRMPETIYQDLVQYHTKHAEERFSYLTGEVIERKDRRIIVVNKSPIFLADDCYLSTSSSYLKLDPEVGIKVLDHFVMGHDTALINIHHHPFSTTGTRFSAVDDADDIRLDKLVRAERDKLDRPFVNVSLVLDQQSIDGRITDTSRSKTFQTIDEIQCLGRDKYHIRYPNSVVSLNNMSDEINSRQDFLGQETLSALPKLRVGICGLGGLGSIIAEALLKLGCRDFVLVDDDVVENTNLNRLQGVGVRQVGKQKVRVVRDHLKKMIPSANVRAVSQALSDAKGFKALTDCDVVFSGVDNGVARALLNQLSVQYMIPLFDAGVQVELKPTNFLYRTFTVLPGVSACMCCSQFELYDNEEVHHAFLDPELEAEYRARGYISDIDEEKAPSVYPLNLMAVGALVTDFLNYLSSFRDTTVLRYSNYQQHLLEVTEQAHYPNNQPAEDCSVCSSYLGQADSVPVPYIDEHSANDKSFNQLMADYVKTTLVDQAVP